MAGTQAGLALAGPFTVDYSALEKLKTPLPIPKGPDELSVDASGQWGALVNLAGLMFAISGMTLAISSANRSRWRAMGSSALIVLGMFIANVVGQLWESASFFRPFSLFYYYQPQKVWLRGDWFLEGTSVPVLGVLAAVGLIGYALGLNVFARRDLPAPL
jgi:ABC-2 type transport system permease protein